MKMSLLGTATLLLLLAGCGTPAGPTQSIIMHQSSASSTGFAFEPSTVSIKAGTSVVWTNHDSGSIYHTVTSDDGRGNFGAGRVDAGSSYSFTFKVPGTYHYHCVPHSNLANGTYSGMVGTITVTA